MPPRKQESVREIKQGGRPVQPNPRQDSAEPDGGGKQEFSRMSFLKKLLKTVVMIIISLAVILIFFIARNGLPDLKFAEVSSEEELIGALLDNFDTGYEAVVVRGKGYKIDSDKIYSYMCAEIANDAEDLCIMPSGYSVNMFEALNLWIFRVNYAVNSSNSDGSDGTDSSGANGDAGSLGGFKLNIGGNNKKELCTQEEVEQTEVQAKAALDQACAEITAAAESSGGSEVEIHRAIFQYLCDHLEYDYELSDAISMGDMTSPLRKNRGIYGALIVGKTVCSGYAGLYKAVCDRLGLDCWIAESAEHAWNLIIVDGSVYCVDATSGDQGSWVADQFFMMDPVAFEQDYGYRPSKSCYIPQPFLSA